MIGLFNFPLRQQPDGTIVSSGPISAPPQRKYGGIPLGDSISAQNPGCAMISMFKRGVPFISNAGVAGNTSAQVLARVAAVISQNPEEVTLQVGTNDWLGGIAPSVVFSNVLATYKALVDAGIRVYVVIPPPTSSASYIQATADGNAYLKMKLIQEGIRPYTPWDQFVEATTGGWISGASGDLIHPLPATRITAGVTLANQIGLSDPKYPVALMNVGKFPNPLMLTDVSGVATGITAVNPAEATFTCVTATGILGKAQRYVAPTAIRTPGPGALISIVAADMAPGKRYIISMKINPKSASNTMGTDIVTTCFANATPLQTFSPSIRWRVTDDTIYDIAWIVDVPAATTVTQILVKTYPDSTSSNSDCDVRFGQLQVFEIS